MRRLHRLLDQLGMMRWGIIPDQQFGNVRPHLAEFFDEGLGIGGATALADQTDHLPAPGFHVLARRWVVERTFAWLLFNWRLSREDERLCATSETWIYLSMIRLMVRRLVRLH